MTVKQRFFKTVYPLYLQIAKLSDNKTRILTHTEMKAPVSFYTLQGETGNGTAVDFSRYAGKKVLLVNTASGCGFTEQFDQLQRLFKTYNDRLVVLAFPTTDFDTDNNSDEEIALFCKENFRVSFPIMKKTVVKNNRSQNRVYQWLTDPLQNGWNHQPPAWNFCKYLVNEEGMLTGYFGTAIEPLGKELISAIGQ